MLVEIEFDGTSKNPIQEGAENEEVTDATNRLPTPTSIPEAAAISGLLLRSLTGEFRVGFILGFQELFILKIEGQRNRLLRFTEIHGGRRSWGEGCKRRGGSGV